MSKDTNQTENPVTTVFTPKQGSPYEKFETLARSLVAVSKKDLDREAEKHKTHKDSSSR